MSKVVLITGITGQDGSYLSELLLSKGYKVHGIVRRVALEDETHRLWRLRKIRKDLNLHAGSLESYASIYKTCQKLMDNGVAINRPPRDGHMAFVRSPDGISIEILQDGESLPIKEPWQSMENTGSW